MLFAWVYDTLISTHPSFSRVMNVAAFSSSSFYNTKSVILCLGITALVCLSVTIFSFQSKVRRTASTILQNAFKQTNIWILKINKSIILFVFPLLQIDVTSCQGVLFSLCMVMLLCAITISIVVPFGYVSPPPPSVQCSHTFLEGV